MASNKKPASAKRASLPRAADFARSFVKDWERLDHPLKGEWADHRERHVGGDFLLIHQAEGNAIQFVRAGTHADLFE